MKNLKKTIRNKKLTKKYIKLNSVNSAVSFYEKYGFVKEKNM